LSTYQRTPLFFPAPTSDGIHTQISLQPIGNRVGSNGRASFPDDGWRQAYRRVSCADSARERSMSADKYFRLLSCCLVDRV
jgi:hypothetical protein